MIKPVINQFNNNGGNDWGITSTFDFSTTTTTEDVTALLDSFNNKITNIPPPPIVDDDNTINPSIISYDMKINIPDYVFPECKIDV